MTCVGGTLNVVSGVNSRVEEEFTLKKPHLFMNLDSRQYSFQDFNDFSKN